MKTIILIVSVVMFASCNANINSTSQKVNVITPVSDKVLIFPYGKINFKWSDIEKQNDTLKQRFIKMAPYLLENEFAAYNRNDEISKPRLGEFKNALHVLDFNNDGLDDLIFDGESGGEPREIAFLLNTGHGFKAVMKEKQAIAKIDIVDHQIKRVYIADDGCCAAHMVFDKIYQVSYLASQATFKRIYFTGHHLDTYFTKQYFNKPFKIEVLSDHYKIRTKPMIDDTCETFISGEPLKGDAIGELCRGTRCRVIASQADNTGRVWWLAEVEPERIIKTTVYYDDNDKDKSSKMGWISSRYVKKL